MKFINPKGTKNVVTSRIFVFLICLAMTTVNTSAQNEFNFDGLNAENSFSLRSFAPPPITNPNGNDNVTCAQLNGSSDAAFSHIVLDNELRLNFTPPAGTSPLYPFARGNGRELKPDSLPNDFNSFVRITRVDNTFSFTSDKNITAVIVKGGSAGNGGGVNVYTYSAGTRSDTGLMTVNGEFGISHISFCFAPTAPTSANVAIAGRVTAGENGIRKATVYLTAQNGETRMVTTDEFGYYRFEDVRAGETYILNVISKRHLFSPQVLTANTDLKNLNFTSEQ